MRYRILIFDFDGTLADSYPWFLKILNDLADEFKFRRVEEKNYDLLRGYNTHQIVKHLGIPVWKLPAISRRMRQWAARDLHEIDIFPGIGRLLENLKGQGAVIGVVSSNSERNVRQVLGDKSAALVDHYSCGASLFGKSKRLKMVVRKSGVPSAEAIYIGDEIRDAEAAREARMEFGAVAWGYTNAKALRAQGATFVFADVEEMRTFLTENKSAHPLPERAL